jgi:hypothetical protein
MLFYKYIRLTKAPKKALQNFPELCKTLQKRSVSFQNFLKLCKTFHFFAKRFVTPVWRPGDFQESGKSFRKNWPAKPAAGKFGQTREQGSRLDYLE